jgi:hypothetical protein
MKSSKRVPVYKVQWSAEDGRFVGTCSAHKRLSHLAQTPSVALAGIRRLVEAVENCWDKPVWATAQAESSDLPPDAFVAWLAARANALAGDICQFLNAWQNKQPIDDAMEQIARRASRLHYNWASRNKTMSPLDLRAEALRNPHEAALYIRSAIEACIDGEDRVEIVQALVDLACANGVTKDVERLIRIAKECTQDGTDTQASY